MTALLDRRAEAQRLTTLNSLSIDRACPVLAMPAHPEHVEGRPQAHGRDPCPKCETRGDLGCAHFAPSEPVAIAWKSEPHRHRSPDTKPVVLPLADRIAIAAAYAADEPKAAIAARYSISAYQVDRIARARGVPKRERVER